jgi:hypothetical protein
MTETSLKLDLLIAFLIMPTEVSLQNLTYETVARKLLHLICPGVYYYFKSLNREQNSYALQV